MARIYPDQLNATTAVVTEWRDRCLIEDGSLLTTDPVWTEPAIAQLYDNIIIAPLTDGRSFKRS
jgi:hypothetical protein